MQAGFIFLAVKVRTSQLEHCPVVPPEEEAHGSLYQVCHKHERPKFSSVYVLRCEFHQRWNVVPLLVEGRPSNDIDWYQDAQTEDCNHQENVPYHPHETEKQNGVQSNLVHELWLLDIFYSS